MGKTLTLAEQIKEAEAEVASWSEYVKSATVVRSADFVQPRQGHAVKKHHHEHNHQKEPVLDT